MRMGMILLELPFVTAGNGRATEARRKRFQREWLRAVRRVTRVT
jgi:hypothetical protein